MTAIKKKIARVQSSIGFFRVQLWPYYKHPRWILGLERERDYFRNIVETYTRETFKDEIVLQLQTELNARKIAYDEAEVQFDGEIEELQQKLAGVYAQNADLWARIAKMLTGGDPHEVQPQETPADR